MQKVYVVVSKERLHIRGCFNTRENAERYVAGSNACAIQELEVSNYGEETPVYDLSEISETEKDKLIRGFVELTAKHTCQLFMSLGLKTHIESKVINDETNEEFIFSFRKVI